MGVMASTSKPEKVSLSANSSGVTAVETKSLSQLSEIFICRENKSVL
jgi:hypothetical protein